MTKPSSGEMASAVRSLCCNANVFGTTSSIKRAFVKATHPQHGTFLQVAPVLAGSERPEGSYRVRDAGETDTDELLAGVGMSPDDCARLRASGVVA